MGGQPVLGVVAMALPWRKVSVRLGYQAGLGWNRRVSLSLRSDTGLGECHCHCGRMLDPSPSRLGVTGDAMSVSGKLREVPSWTADRTLAVLCGGEKGGRKGGRCGRHLAVTRHRAEETGWRRGD